MDWLKKKKDEAKKAASQATAKLQNKRTVFKGEGNVLGGGSGAETAAPAPVEAKKSFKIPFKSTAPPPVSEEEKARRREMQTKAAEARVNAWDKRVTTARNARILKEGEQETKFDHLPPPSASSSADSSPTNRPPVTVLADDEAKRREVQSAQAQLGFNPYAATFSSSTEAGGIMNGMGASAGPATVMPPPAPVSSAPPRSTSTSNVSVPSENGAVYILLRQEAPRAITAAETIIKMLNNILQNPTEEKFRRVRLSNAGIQTKLVAVNGALDILREAGFTDLVIDNENFLALTDEQFDVERVRSAMDRTEVALMQLQVDSTS
ncbi:hypothetical protein Poli38472_010092 [Pythium oligandrum]|uniref:PUB domain-containing protein n=1 Tax=Pythium oligandrum TaxID=41045 RepID=A0A8K1C8U2_PYTOL|nr:hypothetical protein Poli38472_010092 [Pythium oligandrum]|eukprot:TMW58533.1 hypothetical protein Poli38472_010092 [Pythium oligandrum]